MQGPFSQPAAHHLIALLTPQKWQTSALSRNMPLCESSCVAAASISISAQMTSLHIIWLFPWLAFPSRGHYFIYPPPTPSVCLMYFLTDLFNKALPSRTIISQVFPGGELPSQDCDPSFKLDLIPSLSIPATEVHHLNERDFSSGFLNLVGAPCLIYSDKT